MFFLSELLLLLILALIFIFTPDTYIGSKYRLSVYLICNNRYRYRPWKTHIGRPLALTHMHAESDVLMNFRASSTQQCLLCVLLSIWLRLYTIINEVSIAVTSVKGGK